MIYSAVLPVECPLSGLRLRERTYNRHIEGHDLRYQTDTVDTQYTRPLYSDLVSLLVNGEVPDSPVGMESIHGTGFAYGEPGFIGIWTRSIIVMHRVGAL